MDQRHAWSVICWVFRLSCCAVGVPWQHIIWKRKWLFIRAKFYKLCIHTEPAFTWLCQSMFQSSGSQLLESLDPHLFSWSWSCDQNWLKQIIIMNILIMNIIITVFLKSIHVQIIFFIWTKGVWRYKVITQSKWFSDPLLDQRLQNIVPDCLPTKATGRFVQGCTILLVHTKSPH